MGHAHSTPERLLASRLNATAFDFAEESSEPAFFAMAAPPGQVSPHRASLKYC